ncbi:hypothetical protein ACFQAT_10555 [Undibacterium arcticum]|uniref:Uncharacterized protein n=1 Tax=Undibacterium arcticum TaxID=1762892 RepID=A0ABV7FBK5_9BURK
MWRYRIYSAIDPIGTILAVLLINWWAPLFASQDGWLPNWLAWVQTFDASLDAGGAQGSYWGRVAWLNRNPAYGFSYWALGVPFNPSEWRVTAFSGSEATHDLYFYAQGPNGQFNEHYMRNGWHVKLGFKAWNMYDAATGKWKSTPWGPEWRIPFTFSISRV